MKRPEGRRAGLVGAFVVVAAMGSALASSSLPQDVAGYRSWPQLLEQPRPVSENLWFLCRPPSVVERDEARQRAGPHADHLVMVYATAAAAQALATTARSLPPGAILAKAKVSQAGDASPEAVAFMIKHDAGEFPESGGWEFRYYPASGDPRETQEHCAACHQAGKATDFVLGVYPKPRAKQP